MRNLVVSSLSILALVCLGDTATDARVDKIFELWNRPDSPGCAVLVSKGADVVFSRGYGCADLEHRVPLTTSTVFDLCSMSKQFTAMAIVLLAGEKKLAYDDDVRKYVPELPDYGTPITLRQLLHHTSGLREQWFLWELAGWRWQDVVTKDDMLGLVCRQKVLDFPPGTEHAYRNTGYFLLALVVERVSGKSFAAFCHERIFEPLGMHHTVVRDDHTRLVPDRAVSYHRGPDGSFSRSDSNVDEYGDGNVCSSVEDFALWQRNFVDMKVGGKDGIAEMLTPGKTNEGKPFEYGFGIRVGLDRGMPAVWHGGAAYGWRTEAIRYPEQDLSAIVFCNLSDMDMSALVRQVADVFLPEGAAKAPAPVGVRPPPPSTATRKLEQLGEITGTWYAPSTQSFWRIQLAGETLSATITNGESVPLARARENRFVLGKDPVRGLVDFESDAPGDPWRMRALFGMETRPFERVEAAMPPLAEYVGTYRSDEVRATYALVADGSNLLLRRERFDDTRLAPFFADAFKNDWLGVLRFERDAKGKIQGFAISNRVRGVQHVVFSRVP